MPVIRDLLVKLGVESDDALKDAERLDKSLDAVKVTMTAVVAGAAAVGAALGGMALSAAAAGYSVDKLSKGAALTAEQYQELAFVASQGGIQMDVFARGINKQSVALGQLKDGVGAAGERLAQLGLTYEGLSALSLPEQLEATAEAMRGLTNDQERLQVATAIYGEEMAARMIPVLDLGAEGIRSLRMEAHEMGIVMTDEQVASAVEFTDAMDAALKIVAAVKNEIGLALLPVLSDLLIGFRDWFVANKALLQQQLAKVMLGLVKALEHVVRWARIVDDAVRSTFGSWEPVIAAIGVALGLLGTILVGLGALSIWQSLTAFFAFLGGPALATIVAIGAKLILVAAIFAALLLVIDDLITFARDGDSALGRFLDRFREAEGFLGSVARAVETVIGLLGKLYDAAALVGAIFWDVFGEGVIMPALSALGDLLLWIGEHALAGWAIMIETQVLPALNMVGAALDVLISGATGLANALGIEVGGTGSSGEMAAASAMFAPRSAAEAGSSTNSTSSSTTNNANIGGNTYNIAGLGASLEEVVDAIDAREEERNRQTAAALQGGDV